MLPSSAAGPLVPRPEPREEANMATKSGASKSREKTKARAGGPSKGRDDSTGPAVDGDPVPERPKLTNHVYEAELARLQIELVKLQEWIRHRGLKVVVLFEGRDAAGKGGAIKRITGASTRGSPGGRPPGTHRAREDAVVLPALRRPSARGRRDRPVRPQLVQPRRRRAGHGLLHRGGVHASSCGHARSSSGCSSAPGSSSSSTGSRSATRSRSAGSRSGVDDPTRAGS